MYGVFHRFKFPFEVSTYSLDVCHSTPSPLDPRQLHSDPLLSMLRLCYHGAMAGSIEKLLEGSYPQLEQPDMDIPMSDRVLLRALSLRCSLQDCFTGLENARSHDLVKTQLCHLGALLQASQWREKELVELSRLDWKQVLHRRV